MQRYLVPALEDCYLAQQVPALELCYLAKQVPALELWYLVQQVPALELCYLVQQVPPLEDCYLAPLKHLYLRQQVSPVELDNKIYFFNLDIILSCQTQSGNLTS